MKELNSVQVKNVSGGFWAAIIPIAAAVVGFIADAVIHRKDPDAARREGMEPPRR